MKYYIQHTMLRKKVDVIFSIIPSLIFCLKYLPFKQAIRLPILVRKIKLVQFKGTVKIDSDNVKFGMIKLGFLDSRAWPDNGIIWSVNGKVIFKGSLKIGANSSVFVGDSGTLIFGDDFANTANLKIVCCCKIEFGKSTSFGWDCIVMDSNHHPLVDIETGRQKRAFGPISIGDYNWFGLQCFVMHSVKTPERCIFGARSIITRGVEFQSYCVHGGSPLRVLTKNVMRDYSNDHILDYSMQS